MPETAVTIKPKSTSLTAIVAGASGFLGSHLCETLLSQNITVLAVDNLTHGSKDNIKHLISNPNFSFFDFDLNQAPLPVHPETKVDYIFHLAGTDEKSGDKNLSLETLLVNSLGTKFLLDLAKDKKAKFLLVSTADLYTGALSSTSLNYYFGKNQTDEKTLTHHEAKRYAEALTYEYFKKYNVDARICRIKDVFGPRMDLHNGTVLNTLLNEGVHSNHLAITGDGLQLLYPTFVTDVVYGLVKAVLLEDTKGKIFNLINPEKITVLAFTEEMKKALAKNFDLIFKKDESTLDFPYHTVSIPHTGSALNWKPKVSLIDGLIQTAQSFQDQTPTLGVEKDISPPKITAPTLEIPKINLPKDLVKKVSLSSRWVSRANLRFLIFFASLVLLLIGVFYPSLSFALSAGSGAYQLEKAANFLAVGDIDQAQKSATSAELAFSRADQDLANLNWLLTMLQLRASSSQWEQNLFALKNLSSTINLTASSLDPLILVQENAQQPDPDFKNQFQRTLNTALVDQALAMEKLAVAQATITDLKRKGGQAFLEQTTQKVATRLEAGKDTLSGLKAFYQNLRDLIGLNGERYYLVLQTNNRVSKSSGGEVQNYLLFSFNNGAYRTVVTGTVSELNARASADFRPTSVQLEAYGTETFPLTQTLWEVDQYASLETIRDHFESQGQPLEAVILVDQTFLDLLSRAVGASGGLAEVTQKVLAINQKQWGQVLDLSADQLSQKHLVIVGETGGLGDLLEQNNWSGGVVNERLVSQNHLTDTKPGSVVADYLQVVVDSITAGRGEVGQKIGYQLQINNQGLLEADFTLELTNQEKEDFTGYTRVLTPLGSVLEGTSFEDKQLVRVEQRYDKTQFGFPVRVAGGEKQVIRLTYQIPLQANRNEQTTYSLVMQKQVGIKSLESHIKVNLETNYQTDSSQDFKLTTRAAELTKVIDSDQIFQVKIKRN